MEYNATVTLDSLARDRGTTDSVLDGLVGTSPAIGWDISGRMQVTVTVPADELSAAAKLALTAVGNVAGAPVVAVNVMTTAEFDAGNGMPVGVWGPSADYGDG